MAKTGKITISQGSFDTSEKTSVITVKGIITTSGESYRGDHRTGKFYVYLDGDLICSESFTHGAPAESTTTLFTKKITIEHDSDGYGGKITASYNYDDGWCKGEGSKTLTRFWSVSYNANGGSGAPGTQVYVYGGSNIKLSTKVPKRTGYNFLGWSKTKTATKASYAPGVTWKSTNEDNYTLYAVWIKVHTITFQGNGGTVNGSTYTKQSVTNGTTIKTFPTAKLEHHEFVGWNAKADGSGAYYTSLTASKDFTLYAIYKPSSNCYVKHGGTYRRGIAYRKVNGTYRKAVKIY